MLICPKGLNQSECLSLYLDSPEAAFAPANLNPTANFKLALLNHKTPGAGDFFKGARGGGRMHACAGCMAHADGCQQQQLERRQQRTSYARQP